MSQRKKFSVKDFAQHTAFLKKRSAELYDLFKDYGEGKFAELHRQNTANYHQDDIAWNSKVYTSLNAKEYGEYILMVNVVNLSDENPNRVIFSANMSVTPDIVDEVDVHKVFEWFANELAEEKRKVKVDEAVKALQALNGLGPTARTKILDSITDDVFANSEKLRKFVETIYK